MVHLGLIDFTATTPHPRTVRDSLADGPLVHLWCMSCTQKLSATYPRGPHASATPPFPPEHPVLSLPHLIHSNYSLSLTPSHGGASPSPPPLRPLLLAGASPEIDADELHHPIFSSSLGRSFPNEFSFYSISSFKPQARKTTPSYSKPSPSP